MLVHATVPTSLYELSQAVGWCRLARGRECGKHSTRTMRVTLLFTILLSVALCGPVTAQPSPYGSVDGNLGTWKWEKPQSKGADEEREPGETSWERLNAERKAGAEAPPKETTPTSLSPLQLWRLLRGKNDEHNTEQNTEQNDEQNGE